MANFQISLRISHISKWCITFCRHSSTSLQGTVPDLRTNCYFYHYGWSAEYSETHL